MINFTDYILKISRENAYFLILWPLIVLIVIISIRILNLGFRIEVFFYRMDISHMLD